MLFNLFVMIVSFLVKFNLVSVALINNGKVLASTEAPIERFVLPEDQNMFWTIIIGDKHITLRAYKNTDWRIADSLFDFSKATNKRMNVPGLVSVRWIGAYNTNTEGKSFSFEDSFRWESTSKDREVASQVFKNIEEIKQATLKPTNYLDFVEVGYLYDSSDLVEAYNCDAFSFNFGHILLKRDVDAVTYTGDNVIKGSHSEGFIAIGAKPKAIVLRDGLIPTRLAIVEKIAAETGLEIIRL